MATNVASTQTGGLLYAGVASALCTNRRIENDEISLLCNGASSTQRAGKSAERSTNSGALRTAWKRSRR